MASLETKVRAKFSISVNVNNVNNNVDTSVVCMLVLQADVFEFLKML